MGGIFLAVQQTLCVYPIEVEQSLKDWRMMKRALVPSCDTDKGLKNEFLSWCTCTVYNPLTWNTWKNNLMKVYGILIFFLFNTGTHLSYTYFYTIYRLSVCQQAIYTNTIKETYFLLHIIFYFLQLIRIVLSHK